MTARLILIVLALLCFIASAAGVPSRINLTAAGLALLTLTLVLT
jgi:hypothetical protein